jgi:hypothetical protein
MYTYLVHHVDMVVAPAYCLCRGFGNGERRRRLGSFGAESHSNTASTAVVVGAIQFWKCGFRLVPRPGFTVPRIGSVFRAQNQCLIKLQPHSDALFALRGTLRHGKRWHYDLQSIITGVQAEKTLRVVSSAFMVRRLTVRGW